MKTIAIPIAIEDAYSSVTCLGILLKMRWKIQLNFHISLAVDNFKLHSPLPSLVLLRWLTPPVQPAYGTLTIAKTKKVA